jgi:hypothetical protein
MEGWLLKMRQVNTMESSMLFLKKLKIKLPYDPVILLLGS